MPGGEGTGPRGEGAGTGWGVGGCVPRGRGRRVAGGFGRGWGRGMGRGLGRAFGAVGNFFAHSSAKEELEGLKAEREEINSRIAEMEKEKK